MRPQVEKMDEHGHNVLSHSVKPQKEGAYLRKKRLMVLGYVAFCLVYALPIILTGAWMVMAGLPFFLYALYRITWWRFDYDYEYTLAHGELKIERVYSHTRRKTMASVLVKDAYEIAPFAKGKAPAGALDVRGSAGIENAYIIRYRDKEGKEHTVLLAATAKFVRMMSRFNDKTVVAENLPA